MTPSATAPSPSEEAALRGSPSPSAACAWKVNSSVPEAGAVCSTIDANGLNGLPDATKSEYTITQEPLGTINPLRIICIGAGASGINMAYQAKHHLKNVELLVYEKNSDVGGTWFENRYPGCKCDIREFFGRIFSSLAMPASV